MIQMSIYSKIKEIKARQDYQLTNNTDYRLKDLLNSNKSYTGYTIGYHMPKNANWCYIVELIKVDGVMYETVQRFGQILYAAKVDLYNYNEK